MRICQLSHVETAFNFLAPLFDALEEDGHDVVAASNMDHDGVVLRRYLGSGFDFHQVQVSRKITVRAFTTEIVELARYLSRERFDVVHLHGPLAAVQGRLAARLARVPVVVNHAHGFYFHEGMRPFPRAVHVTMERLLGRFLTDYTITVNEEDRQFALTNGFAADPAHVVGTPGVGIDVRRFRPLGREVGSRVRREWGVPDEDLVVTFVGRLVAEKGILELASAFAELADDQPAWLWLVGDVSPTERDQAALGRLDDLQRRYPAVARRTIRLGQRWDVPEVLAATDIFVLPSYREGMPVSLLEAMACGVPVIATDVRGCREAIAGGEGGELVPVRDAAALAEALRKLAADPDERRRLGAAGLARVEDHYTTTHGVAPVVGLYRRIEASRSAPAQPRTSRLRQLSRRVLPAAVRRRLAGCPRWQIAVQHVTDPAARVPDRTDLVFSEAELDDLGLQFVADPFAVQRDGVWHLFFEQVRKGEARGEIATAWSRDLVTWTYAGVVLAEPFHLSYPHLVALGEDTYMIPEASETGSVRLYRAAAFPDRWELADVILEGHAFKDSTLLEHDGSYYLFTETSVRHTHDELRLFVAADVRGPWTEHPASPVVAGAVDAARPAGRVHRIGDRLVRFSQCCGQRYGGGVQGHVIDRLSRTEFHESSLPRRVLQPTGVGWNARAGHHVDAHRVDDGWIRFVDGHR